MKAEDCTQLDECYKVKMIKDKDLLDFQYAEAIREVCANCSEVHQGDEKPSAAGKTMRTMATPLTPRETQILINVARGNSSREIAHNLQICERTVNAHVSHSLLKLKAKNRARAVVLAISCGWISAENHSDRQEE